MCVRVHAHVCVHACVHVCVYAEPHTCMVVVSVSSASVIPLLNLNEPGLFLGRGLRIGWQLARGIPGFNPLTHRCDPDGCARP